MQLAIALYNNHVDNEHELGFRKGDILTVLIENPNGFDGWWLCKHKNKCGLCPENRLQLIQDTTASSTEPNDFVHYSRLSTISMYDSLPNSSATQTMARASNHDYDNQQKSDFISNTKPFDSSPESSSRSSGIYSTNDPQLSSASSVDFFSTPTTNETLSLLDLNYLQSAFKQLSIRSSLIDKYCQLVAKTSIESHIYAFKTECYLFLHNYGSLLDRYTYLLIKETFLHDVERNEKHIIQSATKIIQLIKLMIDLRLKEKSQVSSPISNDVFKKLHLEPVEEMAGSLSTSQIYGSIASKNHRLPMKTSQTLSSDFLTSVSSCKSSNQDDRHSPDPLIKCYYRHINEQIDSILKRYSRLFEQDHRTPFMVTEGKALIVAGHKLIFVLETLHEHSSQRPTPLLDLTRELSQLLASSIQLLKRFSQPYGTNTAQLLVQFRQDIQMILGTVKRIKYHCSLS